ncbi:DUF362 domain-containing protein [Candidatus Lokiarchaeum ossiferum]|uniref:DUF362 domain-containing protein n=1 Tax=Candidatus Lokiarchaeum ossiferum TaxID=2951803 RepID=UPI00352F2261
MNKTNAVVISRAPPLDYQKNYVALPKNYGTPSYFDRSDIKAIRETIFNNLTSLDDSTHFIKKLTGKKVILKPNLVSVFHKCGFVEDNYPESTDPRVIDAIVQFVKPYAKEIIIAESSGRGMPTRSSFKISGLNKIAKHHQLKLIPLEERPVKRYILPQAQVMKEIIVPDVFHEVVTGEAFYISIPKLKTNLYTGVTLGFKNAMGIIPYNLRQRNHNYQINKKLVDMLYLFEPDLVIIDGIVGGEGNTPAPVDPVDSRVIISGTNSVETDRVATRIIGHDPDAIQLITEATKLGFGDDKVKIIGEEPLIPFRAAIRNVFAREMKHTYPNVHFYVGHSKNTAPTFDSLEDLEQLTSIQQTQISTACDGGCVPSIITALEYIRYMGHRTEFDLNVIIGGGLKIKNDHYYIDNLGHFYSKDKIQELPGITIAMGSCTSWLKEKTDIFLEGCMPKPLDPLLALFKVLRIKNYILNPFKNRQLGRMLQGMLKTWRVRSKLIRKGIWLDCPLETEDRIYQPRIITQEEQNQQFIEWPFPEMTNLQKKNFLKLERLEL